MIRSMTGYGTGSGNLEEIQYNIEIRTVNHRFLDMRLHLPNSFNFMENDIKKALKLFFERGRIEVYINFTGSHLVSKTLTTDWTLLDQYIKQYQSVKKRYDLSGTLSIDLLSAIPELFIVEEEDNLPADLAPVILKSIKHVSKQVLHMREQEGSHLAHDIKSRMNSVHNMLLLIKEQRPQVVKEYRERIRQRIIEYTGGLTETDSQLFHQEIALLAEKGDISEELTRLDSHIAHFLETMELNETIGRKLDFIIQEMHREINTVGSKSTEHQIGRLTVQIKSELEKIKEQIQNIE